jgi:hypothetical protein
MAEHDPSAERPEQRPPDDDPLIHHEEEAAASEAAAIGGRAPHDADEERRPVEEAGGGEAEGFEAAEEALVDHAEHTTGEGAPRPDQMGEEAEVDRGSYGEADKPRPTQH